MGSTILANASYLPAAAEQVVRLVGGAPCGFLVNSIFQNFIDTHMINRPTHGYIHTAAKIYSASLELAYLNALAL